MEAFIIASGFLNIVFSFYFKRSDFTNAVLLKALPFSIGFACMFAGFKLIFN